METCIDEVAPDIYRISTHLPSGPPGGITHNQYEVRADQPLLVHTGERSLYSQVRDAVARVVDPTSLRWVSSCHASRPDEYGALGDWLDVASHAQVAHGRVGCFLCLADTSSRTPRPLADGEVLDLGDKRVRWLDTPHVPGPWESGVLYEETTATLFCGDILSRAGAAEPLTSGDILEAAIVHDERMHGNAMTPATGPTLRRLADLRPKRVALMHGPTFEGDGATPLRGLADYFDGAIRAALASSAV
jgi:flavorubredoxin